MKKNNTYTRLKKVFRHTFYMPGISNIVLDTAFLVINFYVVLNWFPLTTNRAWEKYDTSVAAFVFTWLVISYLFGRYKKMSLQKNLKSLFDLLYTSIVVFAINALLFIRRETLSEKVLFLFVLGIFLVNFVYLILYFSYRYASDPEEIIHKKKRGKTGVLKPSVPLDPETVENLRKQIANYADSKLEKFLDKTVDLSSSNLLLFSSTTLFNILTVSNYRFSTIINLSPLNDMRGINRFFSTVNEKLPDDGIFIGCFKDKATRKREILNNYPRGIRWIVYFFYFLFKRVMPALFLTRRLYYDITSGKNRVLAKAEVYGRLYYCGFDIIGEKKIKNCIYFVARRHHAPPLKMKRIYGPLIRLRRIGKNGKIFEVYKLRTMYPYSEFLQEYIFQKNALQEGGKFNHDIRINTVGRFFRRFWLDELPMLGNLFRGQMKPVGIRPLSQQYFNLYSKELQEKRTKVKPGLLPPFYADMPKKLDEIQASEMKYLTACEKKGTFITDVTYLFKIFVNIVFKKARSK